MQLKMATVPHSVIIPLFATLIHTNAGQQVFLLHYVIGSVPFKEEKQTLCLPLPTKILRCYAAVRRNRANLKLSWQGEEDSLPIL